jgi:hypothetical protein
MKREQLQRIESLLQRLDAAVVVRDPGNARAAEAYDGLRKSLLLSSKNHRAHVAHLLSLSESLERGATLELIRDRVNDFLFELGVRTVTEVIDPQLFEIVEKVEGSINGYEVLEPAVVEQLESGELSPIRIGKARQIVGPIEERRTEIVEEHDDPRTDALRPSSAAPHKRTSYLVIAGTIAVTLIVGLLLGRSMADDDSSPQPSTTVVESNTSTSTTNQGD